MILLTPTMLQAKRRSQLAKERIGDSQCVVIQNGNNAARGGKMMPNAQCPMHPQLWQQISRSGYRCVGVAGGGSGTSVGK